MPEMSDEQFTAIKARLRRILRRCGWTAHLQHKKYGWYAKAAKRDQAGHWHGKYIASLYKIEDMETGEIVAILPDVA